MCAEIRRIELEIPDSLAGERLDAALARLLPEHSRTRIKRWITTGGVETGRRRLRPRDTVDAGMRVRVRIEAAPPATVPLPESIALSIVYADADLVVIDKPAGLVVHPGAGNPRHTLVNALLAWDPALAALPRAGLVHRLDKDTSGLLLVARKPQAYAALAARLAAREIVREYDAVCVGIPTAGGTIDAPIGRDARERVRMAVRGDGRRAVTHYRIRERFRAHALLRIRLETGRTHQIRLHLAHAHHPIVGDPVYGGRRIRPRGATPELIAALGAWRRQALHAASLALAHPRTQRQLKFRSPWPADLAALIEALRRDRDARSPA